MHFEILTEDASGKIALEILLVKILGTYGNPHTYRFHHYKGVGRIPANMTVKANPRKRLLLDRLPSILRGYGKSLGSDSCVAVIIDSDRKDCKAFKAELNSILRSCNPSPNSLIRIAVEEIEAWYIGDKEALVKAYPNAKLHVLDSYIQDSVCGTWEKLADAIYPGGSVELKKAGWPIIGQVKCTWAADCAKHMDIERNSSPSFRVFRDGIRHKVE